MTTARSTFETAWPAGRTVAFPGRDGWIGLPRDRRLARSGIAAYSASRPRSIAAQYVAWLAVTTAGPRALGPARLQRCPLASEVWAALVEQWRRELDPFDGVVPLLRRQPERSGFALLLHRAGRRTAFVKLRPDALGREPGVLAAAEGLALDVVTVPRLLATGAADRWHWFATAPMPDGVSRPGGPSPGPLVAEVSAVVGRALTRDPQMPRHWTPSHGDLTVWNVRRAGRRLLVFDWEDATHAPPGTDAVGYEATRAAARGHRRVPLRHPGDSDRSEAIDYLLSAVGGRRRTGPDAGYSARLTAVLVDLAQQHRC